MLREAVRALLAPRRWMPRARWDALVTGVDCPMCAEIRRQETRSRFGLLVSRLEVSDLWLAANQYVPGYCILIYRTHAAELDALAAEQQAAFARDLVRAGSAVKRLYHADKMNYQLLGNMIPHLHWHVVPRHWGDPAPGRPLYTDLRVRYLEGVEYDRVISELRAKLG